MNANQSRTRRVLPLAAMLIALGTPRMAAAALPIGPGPVKPPIEPINPCLLVNCDDGNPCTTDSCFRGVCLHGNPCNDNNACTDNVCIPGCPIFVLICKNPGAAYRCSFPANSASCSDGLYCNGTETCGGGACNPGQPPCTGPDGDDVCNESCDEGSDSCNAPDANNAPCDDGDSCTQTDVCLDGSCQGGNPVQCPAPGQCHTQGACSEGVCSDPIDFGGVCTAGDEPGTCDSEATCIGEGESLCDDDSLRECDAGEDCCTSTCRLKGATETCGDSVAACEQPRLCDGVNPTCPTPKVPLPNGSPCNDLNVCTLESCQQGVCTQFGTEPRGLPCAIGSRSGGCSEAGTCVVSECGNGMVEPGEACDGGECCSAQCDLRPGEPCGNETRACHEQRLCNDREATCPTVERLAAQDSACTDGDGCTLEDGCTDGACVPGPTVCRVIEPKVKKNGNKKLSVEVTCESDQPAECEATLAIPVGGALEELTAKKKGVTKRLKQGGELGFQRVLKLKLNARGKKLLKENDADAQVQVVVRRGDRELRPAVRLVKLLKIAKGK